MNEQPNLYVFSRTYEAGTVARDAMHANGVQKMTFKIDKFFDDPVSGKSVIYGFWWRGYVEPERLQTVRDALDAVGVPWFREAEKVVG